MLNSTITPILLGIVLLLLALGVGALFPNSTKFKTVTKTLSNLLKEGGVHILCKQV